MRPHASAFPESRADGALCTHLMVLPGFATRGRRKVHAGDVSTFSFDRLPRYLLRDRDAIFGDALRGRLQTWASLRHLLSSKPPRQQEGKAELGLPEPIAEDNRNLDAEVLLDKSKKDFHNPTGLVDSCNGKCGKKKLLVRNFKRLWFSTSK